MRSKKTLTFSRQWVGMIAVVACFSAWTGSLRAQTPGNNAVYTGNTTPPLLTNSGAFIDASAFTGTDICQQIYNALVSAPSAGVVIDARGIGSGLNCTSGTPWTQTTGNKYSNTPGTILLPSGLITLNQTWILPNGARLVGEGAGSSGTGSSGPGTTTIEAVSGFTGQMIQMGPNSSSTTLTPCANLTSTYCMGVSVEDLTLDGNNSATGIINGQSREHSYVRRVYLYRIPGIGLQIWNAANFSGPYSDITFSNTSSAAAGTECVWINNVTTRGVHGLSCVAGGSTTPAAAVLVDGVGNSIEDVQIQGFSDGILVGKDDSTLSNVLLNIVGGAGVTNVIHVCGSYTAGTCPSTPQTVGDLSIMNVAKGSANYSIEDDLSLESTSHTTQLSDANVAMYVIGEPVTAAGTKVGYSRFTTSPNLPTWVVQSTSTPPSSCIAGSILSNSKGTSGGKDTLWVCTGSVWTNVE